VADLSEAGQRISLNEFAKLSGVSHGNVQYYWRAWNLAAEAGIVQAASSLGIDEDDMPDEEHLDDWHEFYSAARHSEQENERPTDSGESSDDQASDDQAGQTSENEQNHQADESTKVSDINSARHSLMDVKESVTTALSSLDETVNTFGHCLSDPALGSLLREIAEAAMNLAADIESRLISMPETI